MPRTVQYDPTAKTDVMTAMPTVDEIVATAVEAVGTASDVEAIAAVVVDVAVDASAAEATIGAERPLLHIR